MKYTLPVSFQVNLEVEVDGTSIEDAYSNFVRDMSRRNSAAVDVIEKALGDTNLIDQLIHEVPVDTIELDEEAAISLNPKNVYSVEITRTISVTVEVEAHSEEEAEDIVSENLDNGDYSEDFEDTMCAVIDDEIGRINLERQVERKQVS